MKLNKKVMNLMVALAVSLTSSCVVQAAEVKTPIYINSEIRAEGFIEKGVTYIPLRSVSEILGAIVDWNEETKTVTLSKSYKVIEQRIGSDTAKVNNKVVPLGSPAIMRKGQTYVPLRFVSENLGAGVSWDKVKRAVQITAEGVVSKEQALKDKYLNLSKKTRDIEDLKTSPILEYTTQDKVPLNMSGYRYDKLAYVEEKDLPIQVINQSVYGLSMGTISNGAKVLEITARVKNRNHYLSMVYVNKKTGMMVKRDHPIHSETETIVKLGENDYIVKQKFHIVREEREGVKLKDVDYVGIEGSSTLLAIKVDW